MLSYVLRLDNNVTKCCKIDVVSIEFVSETFSRVKTLLLDSLLFMGKLESLKYCRTSRRKSREMDYCCCLHLTK